jgi:hypothetical protein
MLVLAAFVVLAILAGCSGGNVMNPPDGTTLSDGTLADLAGAGVTTLLPIADIAAILDLQPAQYLESMTAPDRKLGTCAFVADPASDSRFYLGIGVVIGSETIRSNNYRDPATPRPDSILSTSVIRGATAYLDIQSSGEGQTALQNIQIICVKDEVYYFLNTGFIPQAYAAKILPGLPALMDRLIGNTEALRH